MFFLTVLASFMIQLSEVTVISCDARWIDPKRLCDVLETELNEFDADTRAGAIFIIDECTPQAVRLRVVGRQKQLQRSVPLDDIQTEARIRTIALTFGELAQDALIILPADGADAPIQIRPEPQAKDGSSNKLPNECPKVASCDASTASTAAEMGALASWKDSLRYVVTAGLRVFPVAKSLAPEARFGIRQGRWRYDVRAYAMRWKELQIGTTWLAAACLTGGPILFQYEGNVQFEIDALLELGGIAALGEPANADVKYTPKFNFLIGAHLAMWLTIPGERRFKPLLTLEGGLVRGLNVYAGDEFQGGFEGPSTSIGIGGIW
ncbi:MAG: hypothetical protein JXR76_22575 [Deltaproteobacteria bacterium]|nr:hypothetical protein [Deltaproteobacteria bacterium]